MTEQTGSTPEGNATPQRRLVVSAPVSPKPRFLTPGLQAQVQEEQQETIAAEEQAGYASEQAASMGLETPAPVEPVAPAEEPATPRPADDPKIADALAKLQEAQAQLQLAQQQAIAQAMAQPQQQEAEQAAPVVEETAPVEPAAPVQEQIEAVPVEPQPEPVATPVPSPFNTAAAQPPAAEEIPQPVAPQPVQPTLARPTLATPLQTAAAPTPAQEQSAGFAAQTPPPTGRPPIGSPIYGGEPAPKSLAKSKSFKAYVAVFGILVLIIAGFSAYVYVKNTEAQKINDRIGELGKIGAQLNLTANDLKVKNNGQPVYKYDATQYDIDVKPNDEDAKLLISHIAATPDPSSVTGHIHLLAVMAALKPEIADMFFNAALANPKNFSDKKLSQFTTLLATQEQPRLQAKLFVFINNLGKKKLDAQQAAVINEMKYGLTANDLSSVQELMLAEDSSSRVRGAAASALEYIIPKLSPAQREVLTKDLENSLERAEPAFRFNTMYQLLAQTGTKRALDFFVSHINNDFNESQKALDALSVWSNDTIFPAVHDMIDSGKITDEAVKAGLYNQLLYQLAYDRDRTDEEGMKIAQFFIDKAEKETTPEAKRKAKDNIIQVLRNHRPHGFVMTILENYKKDSDPAIVQAATAAVNRIKEREEEKNKPKQTRKERQSEIDDIMKEIM